MGSSSGDRTRLGLIIGQLTVGGAEGQLAQLVRQLDRRFEPIVYALSAQPAHVRSTLVERGVEVREITGSPPARAARLASAMRRDRMDVAHSWLFIANAYAAAATAAGRAWPLITSARNCKVQGRFSRLANTFAFRVSRRIVVNSSDVEKYIIATYHAPAERICVVQNGIDTERFHPHAPDDASDHEHVVTVGRLVRQKNHRLFLEAAAKLAARRPAVHFTIVGDGAMRDELRRLAEELGIAERVQFAGERTDVEVILRQASVFWLTSLWEGMPNVVLEAMASGVPAVVTDVGGTRELVRDGIEGYIVPSGAIDPFVDHTARILEDRALRLMMSRAARERVAAFSTARMARALEALYDDVLGRR